LKSLPQFPDDIDQPMMSAEITQPNYAPMWKTSNDEEQPVMEFAEEPELRSYRKLPIQSLPRENRRKPQKIADDIADKEFTETWTTYHTVPAVDGPAVNKSVRQSTTAVDKSQDLPDSAMYVQQMYEQGDFDQEISVSHGEFAYIDYQICTIDMGWHYEWNEWLQSRNILVVMVSSIEATTSRHCMVQTFSITPLRWLSRDGLDSTLMVSQYGLQVEDDGQRTSSSIN